MSNRNVTKIERLSSGMVKLYDRSNVIGAFSALNSISIGYENNNPRTIQFTDHGNTISFQLFNLQEIIGSTITTTYSPIQTTDTSSDYANRVFDIFNFLSDQVFQGFSPGPTYVGGVVAAYPNFASFPVTGTESVIYIDEADNSAYYWDGSSYQLLVSTGVEEYANFASFPITGSANVIYIDMSNFKPYVWDGSAYQSIGGSATWGGITGTLADQTDLQAALDAKFDDPTGTTSEYIRGDGTLATFPTITSGTVTSVGTTGLISGGPITGSGTITTSMATNKLVGRSTAGTGIMEEITVGSGLTLTGAGILNNTATPTPIGYYGAFQDSTRQLAAAINTPYAVRLNTTDLSDGITIVNNGSGDPTRITIANTGVYNIQFSLQLEKSGGSGNMTADIWLRKNGVDVPSTTGKVVLTGSVNASPVIAAWNYVLDVVGGSYYELMWAVSNIHVEIFSEVATPPHPATPSAILTVTQQSGIMAGTGITAINSLTGAVQTLATGTTGTDFAISSTGTTHTFNMPTASATNTGKLSSTDWNTFNGKFTLPSLTSGSVLFSNGTTIAQSNANFFWDNTNSRLGIGTASPAYALDVATDIRALRLYTNIIRDSNANAYINNTVTNAATTDISIGNATAASITLTSKAAGKFVFTTGNVLIGTTTDSGFKLDVNGTARVQGNAQFGTGFYWDNTNSRLGIGTASPAYRLHVTGGQTFLKPVGNSDDTLHISNQGFIVFKDLTDTTTARFRSAVNQFQFQDASFNIKTLFSVNNGFSYINNGGGNVGIGTTTDAGFKLDVVGTTRTSGTALFQNSSFGVGLQLNFQTGSAFALGVIAVALGDTNFQTQGNYNGNNFRITAAGFAMGRGGLPTLDASALLNVNSTTQGFLPPRMTTTQKNAIASPAAGLMVYDTTLNLISVYNGTMWISL